MFPASAMKWRASVRSLAAALMLAFAALAGLPVAGLVVGPASAQEQSNNLEAQFLVEGSAIAGEEVMVALRFTPSAPEWHGYWKNPGDAGLGMQLNWTLPEGWEAGEPLYPVPTRLIQPLPGSDGLMNHIYKGAYSVLIPLKVPDRFDASAAVPIALDATWLACTDEICVPEKGAFTGLVPVEPIKRKDVRFAEWRAAIPAQIASPSRFEITSNALRLAIPLPEDVALEDPYAFVAETRVRALQQIAFASPQVIRRDGDMVTVEIPTKQLQFPEGVEPPAFDAHSEIDGILAFGGGEGVRFTAQAGDVPTGGELIAGEAFEAPPLWTLLLGALAGGLLLNIMPCVFPILSLKALALAKAGGNEADARADGLAYTAGVVIACVALGALMLALRAAGEQVGWAFQLQSPGVVVFLLVLAIAITANFAGLFELPQLRLTGGSGRSGSFATGLLAAFVATPCTGPFMAAALGAALLLPPLPALVLFAALGLGLALPFLLIGFVPALRRRLPKPGAWMDRFRKAMAIPMGLTALALVWLTAQLGGRGFALMALVMSFGIVLALVVVGRLQRAGKMAWPAFGLIAAPFVIFGAFALPSSYAAQTTQIAAQSIHEPLKFSEDALAKARASGKPVFLWFTADWCVTCKLNESIAIEQEATLSAFEEAGVITMVGDWTSRDDAITRFLNAQGAAGVPLYLWYDGGEPEQLPQLITRDMLTDRAAKAR